MFNVLVESLLEDLGEDLGSWTHINSTLTRTVVQHSSVELDSIKIEKESFHHLLLKAIPY